MNRPTMTKRANRQAPKQVERLAIILGESSAAAKAIAAKKSGDAIYLVEGMPDDGEPSILVGPDSGPVIYQINGCTWGPPAS